MTATQQIEIVIGADSVVRVNVDGVCAMRLQIEKGCQLDIRNDLFKLYCGSCSEAHYHLGCEELK